MAAIVDVVLFPLLDWSRRLPSKSSMPKMKQKRHADNSNKNDVRRRRWDERHDAETVEDMIRKPKMSDSCCLLP